MSSKTVNKTEYTSLDIINAMPDLAIQPDTKIRHLAIKPDTKFRHLTIQQDTKIRHLAIQQDTKTRQNDTSDTEM